jgi:hypothetical protein
LIYGLLVSISPVQKSSVCIEYKPNFQCGITGCGSFLLPYEYNQKIQKDRACFRPIPVTLKMKKGKH